MTAVGYPIHRPRRLRSHGWLRDMVREHHVRVTDLVWPVFVRDGSGLREQVASMPGVHRHCLDVLGVEVRQAQALGIPAVALFPMIDPKYKTEDGAHATDPDNLVCRAIAEVKKAAPGLGVICDVALDPFTVHGQDGVVRDGRVLNDETLEVLGRQAVAQARAGADVIAPSDMMDGRVGFIRNALDGNGFEDVSILAYAAKYASSFYGPFRDAVGSKVHGHSADKRTYQMDPANTDEALREVELDLQEGADAVMVKPGLPYLDIIRRVKDRYPVPVYAYQVSGEYSMLRGASDRGWLDWPTVMLEALLCMKRAGASAILTYAARDVATLLA